MSAPDWRDLFARAVCRIAATDCGMAASACDEGCALREADIACAYNGTADAILTAIAARGYRLHRNHSFADYTKCSRCGVEWGTFARFDSCEGEP